MKNLYNEVGDKMNMKEKIASLGISKEVISQLRVSLIMLVIMSLTLIMFHSNFAFHTYVNVVNFQYTYNASDKKVEVQDYQFHKDGTSASYGGGRIYATEEGFFEKGDKVLVNVKIADDNNKTYTFTHEEKVRVDNQVIYLGEKALSTIDQVTSKSGTITIQVKRKKKSVYKKTLTLVSQDLQAFNGSNEGYSITNAYGTSDWFKSGDLDIKSSSTIKNYPYATVDYLALKSKKLDSDDTDNYDRIIHISGKTEELMHNGEHEVYFADASLKGKMISVVVTLKNKTKTRSYSFMIKLTGSEVGDIS